VAHLIHLNHLSLVAQRERTTTMMTGISAENQLILASSTLTCLRTEVTAM